MIRKIKEVLEKEKAVVFAYLYGSSVRNEKYAKDVDIAVFVKGRVSPNFERRLARKISESINKEAEVVILNDKPLLFVLEVLKNCKLIFSKNERMRINYETTMLAQIQDFNELMKEYDLKRFERYGIG